MAEKERKAYEVEFVNHILEFSRFYDKHKDLCDEITGMKKRVWYEDDVEKKMEIQRHNFLYAIKRLDSFVIDNIHYITQKNRRDEITQRMRKLEDEYINDEKYHSFTEKERNRFLLSDNEKIEYNQLYFHYITKSFDISHDMNMYLQESLMISTSDIKKNIKFYNDQRFFYNLAAYRDEVSNDIANFSFMYLLKHFKKILGYHYTYRILVPKKELFDIDALINGIFSYIMNRETLELHNEANKEKILPAVKARIKQESVWVKSVLAEIYKMTNEALSEKNILPKVDTEVLIDKTLI